MEPVWCFVGIGPVLLLVSMFSVNSNAEVGRIYCGEHHTIGDESELQLLMGGRLNWKALTSCRYIFESNHTSSVLYYHFEWFSISGPFTLTIKPSELSIYRRNLFRATYSANSMPSLFVPTKSDDHLDVTIRRDPLLSLNGFDNNNISVLIYSEGFYDKHYKHLSPKTVTTSPLGGRTDSTPVPMNIPRPRAVIDIEHGVVTRSQPVITTVSTTKPVTTSAWATTSTNAQHEAVTDSPIVTTISKPIVPAIDISPHVQMTESTQSTATNSTRESVTNSPQEQDTNSAEVNGPVIAGSIIGVLGLVVLVVVIIRWAKTKRTKGADSKNSTTQPPRPVWMQSEVRVGQGHQNPMYTMGGVYHMEPYPMQPFPRMLGFRASSHTLCRWERAGSNYLARTHSVPMLTGSPVNPYEQEREICIEDYR